MIEAICVKIPTKIIIPTDISITDVIQRKTNGGFNLICSKKISFFVLSFVNFSNPNLKKKNPAKILKIVGTKIPKDNRVGNVFSII